MSEEMKVLGISKVSSKFRITVVEDAVKVLDLHDGEKVVFFQDKEGEIVLRKQ